MSVRLTKRMVDATIPADRDIILWDSDVKGFGLKVTPAGRRVYFLYYRTKAGQQRRPTIGLHGELTVDQARQIAKQWIAEAALGGDVSRDRRAARNAETVADLARRFITDYAIVHKKPRSVATDRANIENHVLPLIGQLAVREVTRADLERLHLAVMEGKTARQLTAKPRGRRIIRGGAGIANRVLALVSKMFACAEDWGFAQEIRHEGFGNCGRFGRIAFLTNPRSAVCSPPSNEQISIGPKAVRRLPPFDCCCFRECALGKSSALGGRKWISPTAPSS